MLNKILVAHTSASQQVRDMRVTRHVPASATTPSAATPSAATTALLWYPTAATAQPRQAGPFRLQVAADAPPAAPSANTGGAGRWPLLLV